MGFQESKKASGAAKTKEETKAGTKNTLAMEQKGKSKEEKEKEKRMLEERRVAFGTVRRVLVSPVSHVSLANGGRPHSPVKFFRFARAAQEKVG